MNEPRPPLGRRGTGDDALDPRAKDGRSLFERRRDVGSPVDRDTLVERYVPLARQLASRYVRRDEPFDDLLQVACEGLVKAADRYDPDRGIAFSSFAVPTILGELKRHFRDRTWAMRVPRDLQELALRVERVAQELTAAGGRPAKISEIARDVGAGVEQVLEAMQALYAYRTASLDTPRHEADDETLGDSIGGPEQGFALAEDRAMLGSLLDVLDARERLTLRLRFVEDMTQSEIGKRLGVSQMQVSRIIRQAIARMRLAAAARRAA